MTGQDVYPDDALLQQIFGTEVSAKRAEIILQTWDKCIFKIDTTASGDDGDSESVVVRLESASETMKSRFVLCSVLQKMASKYLPDLVPSVLQTGLARGLDGREYCFSVVVFVDGVTLDNVWGQLEPSNQKSIVNDISNAAKELRSMKVRDEAVQTALRCAAGVLEDEATKEKLLYFGGPHTSVLSKGSSLFDAFMERRSLKTTFYTAIREQGRITIESKFPDLGSVTLAQDCMDRWPDEAVFCHNDLTPRNIILNKIQNTTRNKRHAYKLAAIIDWELAGFYPASYELLLQDTYLGINSQYPDFHMMLNEKMKAAVPQAVSQISLYQAMGLISESQHRHLFEGSNISAIIRERFLAYVGLTRNEDVFSGWRTKDGGIPEYDMASIQKIEDDVIAEVLAKRAAKRG